MTAAIAKHLVVPVSQPLSKTDKAPAAPTGHYESPEDLNKRLKGLMSQSKVVLFMKGTPATPRCGFSRKITALLTENGVEYTTFDILEDDAVRQGAYVLFLPSPIANLDAGLKTLNEWPTFPQLIINGEFVGGLDIVQEMVENGELAELLGKSG